MVNRLLWLMGVVLVLVGGCQQKASVLTMQADCQRYERNNLRLTQAPGSFGERPWAESRGRVLLLADVDELAGEPTPTPGGEEASASEAVARGPAHPDSFWRTVGHDLKAWPGSLWEDTKYTYTDVGNLLILGAAGGASVAVRASHVDGKFSDHFREHRGLNEFWDETFDVVGNPGTHFALAAVGYAVTFAADDVKGHETSKTLFNALAINGLTTVALKLSANTESDNGKDFAFPSGHTSSSFAMATVLDDAYGPWVGVPMYGLAAMVGYQRVESRDHDFSDVLFGAALGLVVGKSVAENHRPEIFGMEIVPYVDPEHGGSGLALMKRW
jgi:membrane-associated phospholipid phosphatase